MKYLFLFGFLLLSFTSRSENRLPIGSKSPTDSPTSWLFEINQNGPISMPIKNNYKWILNSEGARILQWKVLLDSPWDTLLNQANTNTPAASLQTKGKKILVTTQSINTNINFSIGGPATLNFKMIQPKVIDENCAQLSIEFQAQGAPAPFYLGISCIQKNNLVTLYLSFPNDVELERSSLFESAGKGENFRIYDLKKITAAQSVLGVFVFNSNGKNYTYHLQSLKTEIQDGKISESRFTISAGGGSMTLKSSIIDFKSTKPFAVLALRPQRVINQFLFGVNFESSIGSPDSSVPSSLSYFQVMGYLAYSKMISKIWELQPRFYFVVSNQSSGSGVGYQTSQIGLGIWNQWQLAKRTSLYFEVMSEAIGSPIITNHVYTELGIFIRDSGLNTGWGLSSQFQSYTVTDSLQNIRKFGQNFFVVKRSF
ncbi:MAG: hypothetical protein J0M15_11700 [Deltaproteobacteria bacterium]|nr:hypothetical protein [Deltaproteobacteria bacterium]